MESEVSPHFATASIAAASIVGVAVETAAERRAGLVAAARRSGRRRGEQKADEKAPCLLRAPETAPDAAAVAAAAGRERWCGATAAMRAREMLGGMPRRMAALRRGWR